MFSSHTIESTISTSLDTIGARLAIAPLSIDSLMRIYGLGHDLAAELAGQFPPPATGDIFIVQCSMTFGSVTTAQAAHQISDILAGYDSGNVRIGFYDRHGALHHQTITPMPGELGLLSGVIDGDRIYFRLLAEGQDEAYEAGEPVITELWVTTPSEANLCTDIGDFRAWLSRHALPYVPAVERGGQVYEILHAHLALRLTAERMHQLACVPSVSALVVAGRNFR